MTLTASEQEVVECVVKGWDYSRIASWLGISPKTARVHIGHIARKLPPHGGLRGYQRVLFWVTRETAASRSA